MVDMMTSSATLAVQVENVVPYQAINDIDGKYNPN